MNIITHVVGHVTKVQIVSFTLSTNLTSEHQYVFLAVRLLAGCKTHYLTILAIAENDGRSVVVIYIDIFKIFD